MSVVGRPLDMAVYLIVCVRESRQGIEPGLLPRLSHVGA